jgi:probable F420-dependent oxidoreductase
MKVGYVAMNSEVGIRPARLALELEQRGFDSMWVPEHSHIPTSRRSPYPSGGPLPAGYLHMMSPFVSLAAAASVTTDLVLATGVALILEHDLLDLACQAATLDVLSDGRLLLGAGVGWNEEELAHHRPDVPFAQRYRAARERVAALRAAWQGDRASFSGTWDRFEESWVYPRPTGGTVPIALGFAGPLGLRHAAEYADHWCPINTALLGADGKPAVTDGVARFRALVADAGRDPNAVPISLMVFTRPTPARLEEYAALGLERIVLAAPSAELTTADDTLRQLDSIAPIVQEWAER